jgi:hypothetical protein
LLVPKRSATCGDSTVRLSIDWGSLLAHIVFLERRSPGGWLECGIRAVLLLGEPPGIKGSAPRRIVATREVNSLGVWRQFCTFANYFLGVSGRPQRCMGFPSRSCPLLNLPENGDFRTAVQGRPTTTTGSTRAGRATYYDAFQLSGESNCSEWWSHSTANSVNASCHNSS